MRIFNKYRINTINIQFAGITAIKLFDLSINMNKYKNNCKQHE